MNILKATLFAYTLTVLITLFPGLSWAQYKTYDVGRYSYAQFSTSGESSIDLFDRQGDKIGILIFLPVEPNLLPNAYQDSNDGLVRLYYVSTQLDSVIDLLRNESPIILNYWTSYGNNSHIGTAKQEPVGEFE